MIRAVRCYHSGRKLMQVHRDILGFNFETKFPAVVESVNTALEMMITSQADATKSLLDTVKIDNKCAIPSLLLKFETVRHSSASGYSLDLTDTISAYSDREKVLSLAAYEWAAGNYIEAANYFETILLEHPSDLLSLRLAQECYRAAGLTTEVLSVMARYPQGNMNNRIVEGTVMGMMATGFIECGRLVEAEETAEKAVALTKGKDSIALQALLTCFQLTGRSSEILNHMTKYEEYHSNTGLVALQSIKGAAHILRGNYHGVHKTTNLMIDELILTFKDTPKHVPSVYLSHLIFLLWNVYVQIGLESMSRGAVTDVVKFLLYQEDLFSRSNSVVTDMANAMLLAILTEMHRSGKYNTVNSKDNRTIQSKAEAADTDSNQNTSQKGGYFGKLFTNFNSNLRDELSNSTIKEDKVAVKAIQKELDAMDVIITEDMIDTFKTKHYENLFTVTPSEEKLEFLQNITPKVQFNTKQSESSDLLHARQECSIPLTNALIQMAQGEYEYAIDAFNGKNGFYKTFGGSAVHRDLLQQTRIELHMRAKQWNLVLLLLKERTFLYPGDPQAFRKLGLVYRALNNGAKAQEVEYTAYQLGIGQGGFGGPL